MILTIDIGNTNITLGAYQGKKLQFVSRMATDHRRMDDQYAIELRDILDLYQVNPKELDGAIICSVVPPLTMRIHHAIEVLSGVTPLLVEPGVKSGLNIRIDNPGQLGADIVAGCVAAMEEYDTPCIILDMGTATTVAVLDGNRTVLGGVIVPGVGISLDALTSRTAQLPQIGLQAPPSVIGTNTIHCMQSGMIYGTAAMLDGICRRIMDELGQPASIVATGGMAQRILPYCSYDIIYNDNLVLDGLRIIYEKNQK